MNQPAMIYCSYNPDIFLYSDLDVLAKLDCWRNLLDLQYTDIHTQTHRKREQNIIGEHFTCSQLPTPTYTPQSSQILRNMKWTNNTHKKTNKYLPYSNEFYKILDGWIQHASARYLIQYMTHADAKICLKSWVDLSETFLKVPFIFTLMSQHDSHLNCCFIGEKLK